MKALLKAARERVQTKQILPLPTVPNVYAQNTGCGTLSYLHTLQPQVWFSCVTPSFIFCEKGTSSEHLIWRDQVLLIPPPLLTGDAWNNLKKKTFQCHSAIPWQCEKKMFRAKWQSHRTIFRAPELRQPFNHAGSWGHKISFFDPNLSLFGYEIVRASPLALIFVDDRYVPLVAPELFLHYSRYFLLWKRDGVDSTWKMIWRGCRQPDQCSNAQWPFAGKCPCNVMQRAGSSPESLSSQRWICP